MYLYLPDWYGKDNAKKGGDISDLQEQMTDFGLSVISVITITC